MLDLFDGQLSYESIYAGISIRNLDQLAKAKIRLLDKKEEMRKRMEEQAEREAAAQQR